MYKLLHTADNHLRDKHLSRSSRGQDFTKALNQVVDIGIEQGVAAILNAGDLLDTNRPGPEIILELAKIHYRLQDAGIWMFVVNGDHDQSKPHWAELLQYHTGQPGGMTSNPGIYVLENNLITIPGTDLTVYGMGFIGKTKEKFMEIRDNLPDADILLWHTQIREFAGFFGHDAVAMADLPLDRYHFFALGDLHITDYRRDEATGTWVGYPGATELIKRDESLEKSVSLVEFDDAHKVTDIKKIPIRTRRVKVLSMNTEEDVATAVQDLEKIKGEDPIVFGRFNRSIPGVVARICATLDATKAIVRLQPFAENKAPDQVTAEDGMTVEDFLPEFLTPGTDSFDLAKQLLQPEAQVNNLIDDFIKHRTV